MSLFSDQMPGVFYAPPSLKVQEAIDQFDTLPQGSTEEEFSLPSLTPEQLVFVAMTRQRFGKQLAEESS